MTQRRNALALGAATLIGAAVIGTVIGRGTETNQPDRERRWYNRASGHPTDLACA